MPEQTFRTVVSIAITVLYIVVLAIVTMPGRSEDRSSTQFSTAEARALLELNAVLTFKLGVERSRAEKLEAELDKIKWQ